MNRPSLREKAYQAIRGWIGSDRLPRGSVTSEIQLSVQLDMSRTPVRAALQQLETEGFLRIVPKHGVLILHSSAQRVSDLLEILISLILFVFEQNKNTKFGEIYDIIHTFEIPSPDQGASELLNLMEVDMWGQFISIGQNQEIIRIWQTTVERVYWPYNHKRWKTPFRTETEQCLNRLLSAMTDSSGNSIPDFFSYLRLLKKTWS